MRSAEFHYGPYTIRTFVIDGQFRSRAFQDGTWRKDVADWSAETLDEAVRRMKHSLDELELDELEEAATALGAELAHCAG